MDVAVESKVEDTSVSTGSGRLNRVILLAAALILLNAVFDYSKSSGSDLLKIGDKVPNYEATGLSDEPITLADFSGKPTVYFFFADWCPCSHESVKWIKKARQEHGRNGVKFVGMGIQDSSKNLKSFAKKHEIDFPVGIGGADSVSGLMGVKTTPTTIFVDDQGIVKSVFVGKIEEYSQVSEGFDSIVAGAGSHREG